MQTILSGWVKARVVIVCPIVFVEVVSKFQLSDIARLSNRCLYF